MREPLEWWREREEWEGKERRGEYWREKVWRPAERRRERTKEVVDAAPGVPATCGRRVRERRS